jgi:hypothetical protein
LAFTNRSAAYFCLEEFELCLQNINLAKNHSYPIDGIVRLKAREEQAKKLLAEKPSNPNEDAEKFEK